MTLEAHRLVKVFGGLKAVDGVSISVAPGEIVGLIGPNGAGKTTSFNLLTGRYLPTEGRVSIDGVDITGSTPASRARRGLARTFQHTSLFPTLSVRENLEVALTGQKRVARREREGRIDEVLDQVAPDAPLRMKVADLPYGVQRRVAVCVAMVNKPDYVLLDEPAAGLNAIESARLGEVVTTLASAGTGILLVEHDLDLVASAVERLYVVNAGRPLFEGTASAAFSDPAVIDAYIGRGDDHA